MLKMRMNVSCLQEFKYREDLREKTIFTIDPKTARDLDDALSIDACDDIDGKGTPGWEVRGPLGVFSL